MAEHKGVDIAHYQNDRGVIDFLQVRSAGYEFVIVKATEGSEAGSRVSDPYFKQNVVQANAAQLSTHAYHFFRAVSEADARAEAQWCLKNISGVSGIDYIFVDVEAGTLTADKAALTGYVNAFLDELARNGRTSLGIYTGFAFMNSRLNESDLRPGILKWIARYHSTLGRDADIWQHTSAAQVPGITGNVDEDTAYTDAVVSADQNKPAPKPKPSGTKKPARKKGSAAVKTYQTLLNKFGYKLTVDGIQGPQTLAAVKDFQRKHGLSVDGIVGPKTLAALKKSPAQPPKKSVVPFPGTLKEGSRGKEVERVQNALNRAAGRNLLAVDGVYGLKTEAAVKSYQSRHRIAADGIVGPKTWSVLF
ncbi:MAG: peptidoglycan-binding protein [Sporolactobacillus sp.]